MSFSQAFLLGIVQGLTEFLPISSSGHLVILPRLLGWEIQPLVFDVFLHLGTALALIVYFWKDLYKILLSFLKRTNDQDFALGKYILIGAIPAGIIGFLLESTIEFTFRGINWVIAFLLLGTLFMWVAEKWFAKGTNILSEKRSLLIGLFQSFALLPGVSRSGASISAGMYLGLNRELAAKFSFLIAIPTVVGAGIYKALTSFDQLTDISFTIVFIGFITSFIVGLAAIKFLLNFVKRHSLNVFIVYRLVLFASLLVYITLASR